MQTISKNATNPDVVILQQLLSAHGFPVSFTGIFDNATDIETRRFQKAKGLKDDGIVGPVTWTELKRLDHLILIDNGHGYDTPGKRSPQWADGSQLFEWEYTREIAQRVESELRKHKVHVVRIVPEDINILLADRCKRVNNLTGLVGADQCFLVSIHCNAFDGQARGWEIHTFSDAGKSTGYATKFWNTARDLLNGISTMRSQSANHPVRNSNFMILRNTQCAAALTENLFMDNEKDCRYLLSPEGKSTITQIHAQAICKILGK